MTVLTRELEIDLSPEVVWETLLHVAAWPRWMVGVEEAGWTDLEDGSRATEGSRLWFRHRHNERTPLVFAEVSALRPGKELAYRPAGGDLPYTEGMDDIEWQWRLFRRPGGTRLRFTLTYEAAGGMPFFQELLGTRMQVLNHADSWLQALRAMAEGNAPVGEAAEA